MIHLKHLYYNIKQYITKNFILISIIIIILGITNFYIAIHNLDLCSNEKNIECMVNEIFNNNNIDENFKLYEIKINNESWTLNECYLYGLKWIIYSFYIFATGSFLFGLSYKGA